MLQQQGITLTHRVPLPDHHNFTSNPFERLHESLVLITAKDAVKCKPWVDTRIWVVHVQPVFGNPEWLDTCHDMLKVIAHFKNEKLRSNALMPGQRRPPVSGGGTLKG
jgi:tetraacyldisaccharide-1-P 4'-kinase